jgi:hypothetical protein
MSDREEFDHVANALAERVLKLERDENKLFLYVECFDPA